MVSLLLAVIYISFISLGLPDSMLGSAWPSMYPELGVPVSYAGIISMIIALMTIISSLQSDRLTRALGAGKVTAVSVGMTALALLGFSFARSYWVLCLLAVPYGLGAGSVDSALNNYVALHFKSRHMSWLHCMWGVGAAVGPYIMGYALSGGSGWSSGYRYVAVIQVVLTIILFLSLPLWKRRDAEQEAQRAQRLTLRQIVALPGAKAVMVSFFCYCAVEQTAGLWASSYLTLYKGVPTETAASFASLFYIGITIGRGICGFVTMKLSDRAMVRLGQVIIAVGVAVMLIPGPQFLCLGGLILIGLGCAPIYPSIIHATPANFGASRSQAVIGVEMASAYVGTCLMPPVFGLMANHITPGLFPWYLLLLLVFMFLSHEALIKSAVGEDE